MSGRSARPRLHFTPRRNWINDPNGLVWHDGEWHLFYQHNPQGDTWGHMSWGHAVSRDLLRWQELPLAIPEDDAWMIFSGSVVVDADGSAGFGRSAMVACYTGHARAGGRQAQCLAYSHDRGRSWRKHDGNPVLDIGLADFRDPKVFRHGNQWVMLVSMAQAGALRFYTSPDLKRWQFASEFRWPSYGRCLPWECPDLLRLPAEDGELWLLKWDLFEGHPAGGSGALAVVGHFDGLRFTPLQTPQWLDHGRDFYAAIAFGATPPGDGRCVWLGWMNDHHYAKHTPTAPWRGAMTLPREVALVRDGREWVVVQQPVRELLGRRGEAVHVAPAAVPAQGLLLAPAGMPSFELELLVAGARWQLLLGGGAATLHWDATRGELVMERMPSPACPAPGYAGRWSARVARAPEQRLRLVVDAGSVEVFVGDGRTVFTALLFDADGSVGLAGDAGTELRAATCWALADT